MRSGYDFQTAILEVRFVHGKIGGEMLDLANIVIYGRIEMCLEAIAEWKLVIDLVFEEEHIVARELLEQSCHVLTAQKVLEILVVVNELLCS